MMQKILRTFLVVIKKGGKMKESKGITLVALIITIIVMLILVAVSVNVAIKSNLIGTAEKTTSKYEEERQKEGNIDTESTVNDKNLNEYIEQLEYKIESNQYMEGITLVCVYTDNSEISFKYDDNLMYDITDSGYIYNGTEFKKVFGYIILGELDKTKIKKQDGIDNVEKLIYDGDCNLDQELTYLDAVTIGDILSKNITFENSRIKQYLKTDYNKDKKMTMEDAEDIMSKLAGE